VTTNNEELGDIENVRIVRRRRTACDQQEPRDSSTNSDEKGKPELRIRPVERKLVVTEAPIGPQLYAGEHLTEIVKI